MASPTADSDSARTLTDEARSGRAPAPVGQPRNYTRWRHLNAAAIGADILGARFHISADRAIRKQAP